MIQIQIPEKFRRKAGSLRSGHEPEKDFYRIRAYGADTCFKKHRRGTKISQGGKNK